MTKNLFLSPWAVTFLYLLGLVACAAWLWGCLPYHNDILVYVYPERAFNLECFRKGLLPLWNPYLSCGIPHLANWQSACFYPPYWLLGVTGLSKGLVWLALLHGAWAYAGFFLWARSQKIPGWICALGAFSFAGSAHFIRCWVNLPFIATASWIPWVFFSLERALKLRRMPEALLALLVLCLQLLAGYPIFVFYTWILLLLWAAFQYPLWENLARTSLFLAGALLLTAGQWLPFLEFLTFSSHGDWNDFPYYAHPWEYLTLLHPTVLGVPGASSYRSDPTNSIFGNFYFGLIPCLFWLGALVWKKNNQRFWGGSSVFLLVWMAGPSFFLWKFIPSGGFDFLEPSKSVGLFIFAACTCLCLFLARLAPSWVDKPGKAYWGVALGALWVLDLGLLPFRLTYRVADPYLDTLLGQKIQTITRTAGGGRILALQTSGQMTVAGHGTNEDLEEKMAGIFVQNLLPNTNMVWGLRGANSYLSLVTDNVKNIERYFTKAFPYAGDLLDVAGVRVFDLPQPLPPPKYRSAGKIGANSLSLNLQASEDMRWVGKAEELPSRRVLLNILARPGSGWRQEVYLEGSMGKGPVRLSAASRPLAFSPVTGSVRPSADQAAMGTDSSKPGFVVWNESYAPGWHAWVDGAPQPIRRAYGLFMAVAVEKGRHQVDFRYEPASFRLGLFASLITLVLGLGLGAKSLFKGFF